MNEIWSFVSVPSVIFGLACILVATLVTLATYWAYVQKHDDHSESRMRRRRLAVDDLDDDLYDGYGNNVQLKRIPDWHFRCHLNQYPPPQNT